MTLTVALWLCAALAEEAPAKITDLAWLAGSWRGNLAGGKMEEVWTPAEAGVMMGMFRLLNTQGQASVYEFQILEETATGVSLKIKHFNRALKGEELPEKFADFHLTRASTEEAQFESLEATARVSLLYRRLPNDRLEIVFRKAMLVTGKEQKIIFSFDKAK